MDVVTDVGMNTAMISGVDMDVDFLSMFFYPKLFFVVLSNAFICQIPKMISTQHSQEKIVVFANKSEKKKHN